MLARCALLLPLLEAEHRPWGGGWQPPCPAWSPVSSHRHVAAITGGVRAQPSPQVPIWDSKTCWVISSLLMASLKVPCFGDLKPSLLTPEGEAVLPLPLFRKPGLRSLKFVAC